MKRARSWRILELGALVGGAIAAGALGWVVAQLGSADRSIGSGVVAEQTAVLTRAVEARWRVLREDPEVWFGAASGAPFEWGAELADFELPAPRAASRAEADAALIATLLRRAERQDDGGRALQSLEAARELADGPVLLAEVGVRAIRIARDAGDDNGAREAFERLWAETPGDVVVDGYPARAAGLIAAARVLDDERTREAARELLADLLAGELTLLPPTTRRGADGQLALEARTDVLLERLGELAGDPPAASAAAERVVDRAHLSEIEALLPDADAFRLAPLGGEVVAIERRSQGGRSIAVPIDGLVARLGAALAADPLFDPEVTLTPAAASTAERLGSPFALE
ncbi:MAG: hypothetical protein AAFZ65_16225, partial [Planctomycetota bacterium]